MTKLCLMLIAATALTAMPTMAQDASTGASTNAPAPRPARAPRLTGKITAVDSANMTLTVTARGGTETKAKVSSTTKITKDREPATFADATKGLNVSIMGKKGDDGVWEATSVALRTPPAPKPAAPPAPDTK